MRDHLARVPRAAWPCALVGIVHAMTWAVISPPMMNPDEINHYGYAQYIAEEGRPPPSTPRDFGPEQAVFLARIPFTVEGHPTWSPAKAEWLFDAMAEPGIRKAGGAASATNYPPLYYGYEALAYRAAIWLDGPDRLLLMRLWSALLMGLTVLGTFFFIRELMPGSPWAWTVGALGVAFQPQLAFITGGLNNDAMLATWGALLFAVMMRVLRRGLTVRRALLLVGVLVAGILTKQTFLGLAPAAGLTILLALWRSEGAARKQAWRATLVAGALALGTLGVWIGVNAGLDRTGSSLSADLTTDVVGSSTTLRGQFNYTWTSFLPRLPGMDDQHRDRSILNDVYFQGFLGRFGYNTTEYREPIYSVAMAIFALLFAAAAAGLWRARDVVRRRIPEITVLAVAVITTAVGISIAAYRYQSATKAPFEQTRYLFGLIALWGLIVVLAARGSGRRRAPAIGAALVVLAVGHSLLAQIFVLARFYA